MNTKATYLLFAVFLAMIVGLGVYTVRKAGFDASYLLAKAKARKVKPDDVTGVVIERTQPAAEKLVFERTGKKWTMTEPVASRADNSAIDQVVNDALGLRREDKPGTSDRNPAAHGLDKPSLSVTLKKGDEVVGTVHLGALQLGESSGSMYVNSSDYPSQAFLVGRGTFDTLFDRSASGGVAGELLKGVGEWRSKDLLAPGVFNPIDSVQTVKVQEGKSDPVVIAKGSDNVWRFEKPAGFGVADTEGDSSSGVAPEGTPPTGVKPLLNTLSGLRVGGSADYVDDAADLAKYGLDEGNAERLRVELVRKPQAATDGDATAPVTEVLYVGKKVDDKGEKVYAKLDGDAFVVKVSAKAVDPFRQLAKKPSSLRDRSLVTSAQQTDVDAIDLKVGGDAAVVLRKLGEPAAWKLYDASGNSLTARTSAVADLLNALSAKRLVVDFPTGKTDAELGLDKPQAEVTLWLQAVEPEKKDDKKDEPKKDDGKGDAKKDDAKKGEKKEEKKEPAKPSLPKLKSSATTIKLTFGRKDKDVVYVRRVVGTEKADVAVPARTLESVSKSRVDFIDTTLPGFSIESAETLSFGEFVFAKDGGKWVVKQPASLAGRAADPDKVRLVLDEFSRLTAQKLVTEKGTEAELGRWGLQPPQTKVTVALKDGTPKERVYVIGKPTDDKTATYAKLGEQDVVFTISNTVPERLAVGDVVDPTVLRFDLSAVKGLKLSGWEDLGTGRVTLNLARAKPNEWTFRDKGPFEAVSGTTVEGFLAGLLNLRAEGFVNHTGEVKPEYKLDPKDGAFTVEIEQEGLKEPWQLTVGGPDPSGKFSYATSKQLPKDVFLVPKEKFEEARKKPAYFKK